jgi:hypothetical protein
MSLLSLASIGLRRDLTDPGQPLPDVKKTLTPTAPSDVASFGQLLVAQIPTEVLVPYTTLLAVFASVGASYQVGRWIVYALAVALCPVSVIIAYLAQADYDFEESDPAKEPSTPRATGVAWSTRLRHLPILPATSGLLAMGIYGLTLPGSALAGAMARTSFGVVSASLAVGGGVILSMLAPFLGKGNGARPKDPPSAAPKGSAQTGVT